MKKRIIYSTDKGGVGILIPALEALNIYSIDEIAKKDVPAGVAYKIIDVADIPEERTFRNAWEANITEPDGVGLGYDAWFALQSKLIEV